MARRDLQARRERDDTISSALTGLVDGTRRLIGHHLELLRHELSWTLQDQRRQARALLMPAIAAATALVLSYVLVLVAIVLLAVHYGDLRVAAGLCVVLALGHGVVGLVMLRRLRDQSKGLGEIELDGSRGELQRSKEWMKQLPKEL